VLDAQRRVLISGDPIQDGEVYLFGPYRELHAYLASLEKAEELSEYFDEIWPSHGTFPVKPELIGQLIEGTIKVLSFSVEGEPREMHGQKVMAYNIGSATLLCDE
jgi:glyoxylase-like metal-dependent hydrolase (beta-lactamase superfamily II)